MKNVAEKIKFWVLDAPKATIWLIRIKKIDPNAEDVSFVEWLENYANKEKEERDKYTKLLLNIYIDTKVANYRKKLVDRIVRFKL